MAPEKTTPGGASEPDTITFAEVGDGLAVVRVSGRGSFANSVEFKQLADHLADKRGGHDYRIIVDLDSTITLDSTFMGALAGVGLRHKRDTGLPMILCNVNDQCCRLLGTVGIRHFVDVRPSGVDAPGLKDSDFKQADSAEVSRADRIVHMIEAHENLVNIDGDNQARFEGVLKYLNESLSREEKQG